MRARDQGLECRALPPGERNSIADVPGMRVGQATIAALRAHGHDVVALARSHHAAQQLELLGAETVAGDLTDTDALRNTAERADAAKTPNHVPKE